MSVESKWQQSDKSKELLFSGSFLLPEEIRLIIKDSGIGRDYLADQLGITYNHLSKLINNIELRQKTPAYEHAIRWLILRFSGGLNDGHQK